MATKVLKARDVFFYRDAARDMRNTAKMFSEKDDGSTFYINVDSIKLIEPKLVKDPNGADIAAFLCTPVDLQRFGVLIDDLDTIAEALGRDANELAADLLKIEMEDK